MKIEFLPRPMPVFDYMHRVKRKVSILSDAERNGFVDSYQAALRRLQFGGFDWHDLRLLVDAFNLAEQLTQPGFNLANDHRQKFEAALATLEQLAQRKREHCCWATKAGELDCLRAALEMHDIQLQFASRGELHHAENKIIEATKQALAGNFKGRIVIFGDEA